MNYQEQLLDARWKAKRIEILNRDRNTCQICSNQTITKAGIPALIVSHFNKLNFQIFDIRNGKPCLAELYDTSFYHQKHKSTLCYFIPFPEKNIISGIIDYSIDTNPHSAAYSGNLDEGEGEVDNFLYNFYQVDKAKVFLKDVHYSSFHWKYGFNLHIHHKYYQAGLLPWKYPQDALTTLCWTCHERLHTEIQVPCLDINGNDLGKMTPCTRCLGAGIFPEYSYIQAGICFRCNGARYEELA